MRKVPLSQGMLALVSDKDYARVSKFKWYAQKPNSTTFYAVRSTWVIGQGAGTSPERVYMHRFILGVRSKKYLVDHKDRDGLNNQRNNLRKATKGGNRQNAKVEKNKLYSAFKGVCFRLDTQKFTSHISVNGVQRSLGCYTTEIQAAKAYDRAAVKAWRSFARINFPRKKK